MIPKKDLAKIIGIHLGDGCISITSKYFEYALSGDINEEKEYYDEILTPLYNNFIFYNKIILPFFIGILLNIN